MANKRNPQPPFDPRKMADPSFKAPDILGTVEGWRGFVVLRALPKFGVPPKLRSVTYGYYWTPRKRSQADCDKCSKVELVEDPRTGERREVSIGVPGERCSCGFYSAKTREHLISMRYHMRDYRDGQVVVIAKVANWGKVIEGTEGWRAQFSYPSKLFVPHEAAHLAKPLQDAYGVLAVLDNTLKRKG